MILIGCYSSEPSFWEHEGPIAGAHIFFLESGAGGATLTLAGKVYYVETRLVAVHGV